MNGSSFFDFLLLVIFVVFIITRFMSHKLPRDESKDKKPGENRRNAPAESNVVDMGKRQQPIQKPPQTKFSPEEIEKLEGVEKIKAMDPTFNEKEFKEGAKQAFMLYWQAVAEVDDDTLANLCSPRLFESTMDEAEALEENGKHKITRIDKLPTPEIIDTRVSGKAALIDLKYTPEMAQSDVKKGTSNTEAKAKKTSTVWTWARNVDDSDPNWELEEIKPVN